MNTLLKLLDSPLEILGGFVIVVFCIKETIEIVKYFKNRGKEIYDKDAELESMKSEIADVQKKQEEQATSTLAIQNTLVDINATLVELERERKADTVAQGRAMLYDLYNQLKDKPSLTLGENEVVRDVFTRYEHSGGNGTFKTIANTLLSKPIEE